MDNTISNELTIWFLIYAALKTGVLSMDEFIKCVATDYPLKYAYQNICTDVWGRAVAEVEKLHTNG